MFLYTDIDRRSFERKIQFYDDGRAVTALLLASLEILFVGFSLSNRHGAIDVYENGRRVNGFVYDAKIVAITAIPCHSNHFLIIERNRIAIVKFSRDEFLFSTISVFKTTHSLVSLDILKGVSNLIPLAVATRASGILLLILDTQNWTFSLVKK